MEGVVMIQNKLIGENLKQGIEPLWTHVVYRRVKLKE